jgi:hypothetical protein
LGGVDFAVKEEALGQDFLRVLFVFFPLFIMAQQPLVVQGLHIIEASCSHSDTPHSVGLL